MTEEIFLEINLPSGSKAVIYEGCGRHFFKAFMIAKGDDALFVKHLIIQLMRVNGKELTETDIDNMHIRDISYASEVITAMLSCNDLMSR